MARSLEIGNLLQKDRLLILWGLALITVLAWAYMLHMVCDMVGTGMDINLACLAHWGPGDLTHMFFMWAIMMVVMMFPSATPMILMFTTVNQRQGETQRPLMPTGLFVLGYFLVWTAYSALAAMAQWGLHIAALLSHHLVITNPLLGGVLLVAAGVFQWTPFRDACMSKCRSPLGFLMAEWREGRLGALIMGLKHGAYCVGCCWLLMILSFVLGVMNMLWMAILTVFMLVEKVCPRSRWVSRTTGLILVAWGLWVATGVGR
jgi:predicted metal-binding membrane protein